MIHFVHDVGFHTETLRSLVATAERLQLHFRVHFVDDAVRSNRFGIRSFRPVNILQQPDDLQHLLRKGDIVFFVTFQPGEKVRRWLWLDNVAGIYVYGIVHNNPCQAPLSWTRVVLTGSRKNQTKGARVYFQIEQPQDLEIHTKIPMHLPQRFFLMVGNLDNINRITSDEMIACARALPLPIVILGSGQPSTIEKLSVLGPVYTGLTDTILGEVADRSDGIVFIGDHKNAPEYERKFSGCFSLAIKHGKPVICDRRFFESHEFTNGIEIGNPITPELLKLKTKNAKKEKMRMIEENSHFFSGITSSRIVIIAPTRGMGSLGDEAIVSTVVGILQKRGFSVSMAESSPKWKQVLPLNPDGTNVEKVDSFFASDTVLVCGADVLDGRYGGKKWLQQLCASVQNLHIVGISVKNDNFFDGLKVKSVTARDNETYEVLKTQPVFKCLDPAFLLKSTQLETDLETWLSAGQTKVGVNFPGIACVHQWLNFLKEYVENLQLIPIPHDFRQSHDDVAIAQEVINVASQLSIAVWKGPYLKESGQVKGLASKMDLVMSARMHLCIAALGSGVPVVAFPYDSKFQVLKDHFEDNVFLIENQKPDAQALNLLGKKGSFESKVKQARKQAANSIPPLERSD